MASTQQPVAMPKRGGIVALALTLATMLATTNQFGLSAFFSVISEDLAVSVPLLGQITTLVFLGSAGIGLLAGPIADQYGKRRVLVAGLAIILLSCLGTSLAPSYGWLLATRLIAAVSGGLMAGTTLAVAGVLFTGPGRRRAMGAVVSGNAVAGIVGVPGMTFVASFSSWRVSYVVLGLAALAMVPLMYRLLPDDGVVDAGRVELRTVLQAYRPVLAQRSMVVLYTATVTRGIGWAGTVNYFGAFLGDELGFSNGEIGLAFMITAAGYFLGTRLASGRLGDGDPRKVFGVSTLAMALFLGLAMVLPLGTAMTIAFFTAGTIVSGLGFVIFVTLLSTETLAGQGTTMSLNQALFAFGTALGSLFGGLFLAVGGYALLGCGLMMFSIVAALIVWRPARVVAGVQETPGTTS